MKKLVLIGIFIAGIVFISGCIGGEKAADSKTSIDSQTNQIADTQTSDSIIKQSDVPGITLNSQGFYAAQKSSSYTMTQYNNLTQKAAQSQNPVIFDFFAKNLSKPGL